MTTLHTSHADCGCGAAGVTNGTDLGGLYGADLPNNPFHALRVAYGMLLGEDDFRVLMGNPRGKLMLHSSWLHGRGVVWGMASTVADDEVRVEPGLAIDGWGRELRLTARWCLSASAWVQRWLDDQETFVDCESRTVHAWIVAEFDSCLDRPVPALADPCDVTRKHDDFSRIFETTRIVVVDAAPVLPPSYHRVRVLLGLDEVGENDPAGREALDALSEVVQVPWDDRAGALLKWFRRLAARDVMDLEPVRADGDDCPPLPPVPEEAAGVLLAKLEITISARNGCANVESVRVDPDVRTALLPTSTIAELTCGLAPGILGRYSRPDADGPRLIRDSVHWTSDHTRVSFRVTKPLAKGSVEGAIQVSSLADDGRGWSEDDVERVQVSSDGLNVRVYLDQEPKYETVRLIVRGTGRRALFGADPRVPFAGIEGGPPGTEDDGHDAVITMRIAELSSTPPRRAES
jgi:hypothetical protein